jgi:transposase-like protein
MYVYKCRNCGKTHVSLFEYSAQKMAEQHMMQRGHIVEKATEQEIAENVKKTDEFLNRNPEKVK